MEDLDQNHTHEPGAVMRAVHTSAYGPPASMQVITCSVPVPAADELVVNVRATTVNPADWHLLRGDPRMARLAVGLRRPRNPVLGCEVSGTVVAVGADVPEFAVGDEVVASTFMEGFGAFADYVVVQVGLTVLKPASVSHEHAATVPLAGLTALQALVAQARVTAGQRVLIIGACGGVGSFAVQLATHYGAAVTAVCSTSKADLARSLGAQTVVDYTEQTLGELVADHGRYDVVVQLAGRDSIRSLRQASTPQGCVLALSGDAKGHWLGAGRRMMAATLFNVFVRQRIKCFTVEPNIADMNTVLDLVAAGQVTPLIDRTYALEQVPQALAYLEEGHAGGKVVITT